MAHETRFQIFVSSTFKDLQEERKQTIEAIIQMGHIPIALERFSPANQSDLEVIKKTIADCQIYILILGHRYGEVIPNHEISYTELEYNIARENELTILTFLMEDEDVQRLRKDLDANIEKDKRELESTAKFNKFRNSIKLFRKMWRKSEEFKSKVILAIHHNLDKVGKPGFVKEPEEPTMSLLASASRNEFIVDIVEQLRGFHKLYQRCSQQIDQKQELSELFRERYLDRIINNKVSLFFESGSTVAYVARALSETLSKVVKIKHQGKPNIEISTNNVLAYLQLWLTARIPCTTFPWSPPVEDTYGSLYGGLMKIQDRRPTYDQLFFDESAIRELQILRDTPFGITSMKSPTLILATTSGVQISKNHKLKFINGLDEAIQQQLSPKILNCFGPHVGSYRNMIFKRFLYETRLPIMFFITGEKIDCEIDVGRCHFVFDSQFSWVDFYQKWPVAFCVGCKQEDKTRLEDIFKDLDFEIECGDSCSFFTAFIAKNQVFTEQFEKQLYTR